MPHVKKLLLISILFFSSLNATVIKQDKIINNSYFIRLGVYNNYKNVETVLNRYTTDQLFIKKNKNNFIVDMVNFADKESTKKRLKEIKKIIKDAYIKTNSKKSRTKTRAIKKINPPKIIKHKKKKKEIHVEQNITIATPETIMSTKIQKKLNKNEKGLLLKEAILKALNINNKILSQREKVIQAKRKVDEAKSQFRPTAVVYATTSTNYLHPENKPEEKYEKADLQLSITQNLYSGHKDTNNLKKQLANLEVAALKFKSQVEQEVIKITEAYLNIIYEKEAILVNRENMKNLQNILNIVTIKENSGAATKGDLNYIKSNVENATSALIKAESKYSNAVSYYQYYLGDKKPDNQPIQREFNFKLNDKNTTLKNMKKSNTKLQIIKSKLKSARFDFKAKNAAFRPTLDLILTTKGKRSNYEAEPREDKASAALSLNYNLYNGGKHQAIKLGVASKISELSYNLLDSTQGTEFNTKQVYENTKSAKDSLKHTHNEVQANIKVIDSYWSAFKYGTQDLQALLLAQRALNRSQLDEIKERQNYIQGYFKLLSLTGELLEYLKLDDFTNPDKL